MPLGLCPPAHDGAGSDNRHFLAEARAQCTLGRGRHRAGETAGGFVLSGTELFVPDAHLSDALVIAMRAQNGSMMENGLSLFLVTKDTADLTVTSPGSTTCTSTSSAPRPPRSPSTTRSGTASAPFDC